ncbi:DNA methyltransferase [Streptomyces sp. NBC_01594]
MPARGPAGSERPAVLDTEGVAYDLTPLTADIDGYFLAGDGVERAHAALAAGRASTEHAVAMVFTDWRQEPTTSDALQMAGWTWSGTIPWIKPSSRPRKGGPKQDSEFIIWGVKGSLDNTRDLYLPGHYIASQPRKGRVHITQKPVEVMQQLVQVRPEGGTVLDPFTGSGSTGVAALREGRRFVGVELSAHYADVAEERLRAELTKDDFELAGPEARA